ncbi:MAG TPA: hypothetical protein VJL59_02050 [Anaerolineales bacterium]|nr:hypothetical protein [Anaerolineales bacterium]
MSRLSIHFFVFAIVSFALGLAAAPWLVVEAVDFFYQPHLLALVHTFTLGWITPTIMGVMYRFAPALTKRPLRFERLALVQLGLYLIGVIGMVAHFAVGSWPGNWSSSALVVVSGVLFAVNLLPGLASGFERGVAEAGMFLSVVFFIAAATLGFLFALDKSVDLFGGSLIPNLGAHAALAGCGWITLTICALSYRFVPAFLLPKVLPAPHVRRQLYGIAFGATGLAATLIVSTGGAIIWSGIIVVALLAYAISLGRIVRSRQMPIDWTIRHALAGLGWLVIAAVIGLVLASVGAGSEAGSRFAAVYGIVGLFGWASNLIIGFSYQLFPAFVLRARAVDAPPMTIADVSLARLRLWVFFAFNAGIVLLVFGFAAGQEWLVRLGATLLATGGLPYAAATLWTLSHAYRRSTPQTGEGSLRIVPS